MSPGFNPLAWSGYLATEATAAATLTGLIFVAVSINLPKIVISRALVARAGKALCALMGVLAATTFALVPEQTSVALGMEITVSGIIVWIAVTWTQHIAEHKNPYVGLKNRVILNLLTQTTSMQLVGAGISLWAGTGGGLYWLVGACLGSFVIALLDAWVLLIEIQR